MVRRYAYLISVFLLFSSLHSVELQLELVEVSRMANGDAVVGANDDFQVRLTVRGQNQQMTRPQIDGLDQLQVYGTSASRNISIGRGAHIIEAVYTYDVTSPHEGDYIIGPARVSVGDDRFSSNSVKIHVGPTSMQQPTTAPQNQGQNYPDNRRSNVIAQLQADKKEVVVGEPIILSLQIKTQGQVLQVGINSLQAPGFIVKEIEQIREQQTNGMRVSIKQYVLIPTQSGTKKVGPIKLTYQVPHEGLGRHGSFADAFFANFLGGGAQVKNGLSNEISIKVNELNTKQEIDGVGEFTSFSINVNKRQLLINEPCTLSLELLGKGNLEQCAAPELTLPRNAKAYSSKSTVEQDLKTEFGPGKKKFEYVLQLTKPGIYTIPSQKITYFDTTSRTVKTLSTQPISLSVTSPTGESKNKKPAHEYEQESSKEEEADKNEHEKDDEIKDIHFIEEEELTSPFSHIYLPWWLLLMIILFIPAFSHREKLMPRLKQLKEKIAGKKGIYRGQMAQFKGQLTDIEKNESAERLYAFFMNALSFYINIPSSSLNEQVIEEQLLKKGWSQDKINEFIAYLNECVRCTFAHRTAPEDVKRLCAKASYWFMYIFEGKRT